MKQKPSPHKLKCVVCNETFAQRTMLIQHTETVHTAKNTSNQETAAATENTAIHCEVKQDDLKETLKQDAAVDTEDTFINTENTDVNSYETAFKKNLSDILTEDTAVVTENTTVNTSDTAFDTNVIAMNTEDTPIIAEVTSLNTEGATINIQDTAVDTNDTAVNTNDTAIDTVLQGKDTAAIQHELDQSSVTITGDIPTQDMEENIAEIEQDIQVYFGFKGFYVALND